MKLDELTRLYDFRGCPVVITGGAGILGGEMACALVGCGASVAIIDRDPARADRLVDRLHSEVGRALIVFGDVLQPDTLQRAAEQIRQAYGPIRCLINAAGGNRSEATTSVDRSFFDLTPEALRSVVELNLLGTVAACQAFGRDMVAAGQGAIVNLTSMNAVRPLTRIPAYSGAKAAVSNFTQWLAVHMAQTYSPRIRVNALAPGFFLTEQNRFLMFEAETGELTPRAQAILAHTPMGRFGSPEDLLGALLWLLSPASAFVTGIVVPIDGGFSAFSGV